jgi:hypothetical protein
MDTIKLKLVVAEKLLEALWEQDSRPSLRWLRTQQKNKAIPAIKVGRRVWFDPEQVRTALETRRTIRARAVPGAVGRSLPC